MIEIEGPNVCIGVRIAEDFMNDAPHLAKLAELRAKTDQDLVVVLAHEIQSMRAPAPLRRLATLHALLAVLETNHQERLRLQTELELLRPRESSAAAA